MDYIKSLHEGWSDEVMTVLDSTPPESVEQRDLFDRSPELLRSWADGNVVLIGDAVHPMMPNLGMCFGGDPSSCMGGSNGPGFGWEDTGVIKLGYQYDAGDWQARAGYSHNDQPIPDSETLFNILAPGVVEDHWSLGYSMNVGKSSSLDFSFTYMPSTEVTGGNPLAATPAGDTQLITIEMKQFDAAVNYTWRY